MPKRIDVDEADRLALGARLQEARKGSKLSQKAVSQKCGRDAQTIYRWEAGRTVASDAELRLLAELYRVNFAWLRCGAGPRRRRAA
jgi:transcriptional regulator with XRE-family HTH domain